MGVGVGGVVMDGETAETLAGVVRLLRRSGAWVRVEVEGPRSPRQLVALACIGALLGLCWRSSATTGLVVGLGAASKFAPLALAPLFARRDRKSTRLNSSH